MTDPITRARLAGLPPVEAAALWHMQQEQGLPVEAGLFDEWLAQSEANRSAWAAVEKAMALFDDADDPDFAALRAAALADRPSNRWHDVQKRWRPAAAAAVLVAVVVGGLQLSRLPFQGSDQVAGATDEGFAGIAYTAPAGAAQRFALKDGTMMTLEPGSQARVLLTAKERQLVLDRGSVTLAVVHDASRPFKVAALDRTIIDVGTRFQVALEGGAMRVALYEGSVRVEGGRTATVLQPGDQLVARAGRRDIITRTDSASAASPALVEFDDVTLVVAAEIMNEGSTLKLVITDPKIAGLRVSGRFRRSDPERFARSVADLLSLRVVRASANQIELRRKS